MNVEPPARKRRPARIALTGGIATGKSYVSSLLAAAGVPLVDADVLAREAVAPGSAGLQAVTVRFGRDVVNDDGTLNRAKLGGVVFGDPVARRDLEAIVHPFVRRRIDEFFVALAKDVPFAVADVPLLFETGQQVAYEAVIVVACRPETQLARLMKRDQLSREEADRRIAAQWPIADKVQRADYVIRTDGTYADTDQQVTELLESLRSL